MGCNVREKHVRTKHRPRSAKAEIDHTNFIDKSTISKAILESGFSPLNNHLSLNESPQPNSNPNPDLNPSINARFDDNGWGYCTEEQLEEILLKNLEFLYSEAVSKLVAMGYDEAITLKAILRNGHCYGGMDVLTNIMHNSLAYLSSASVGVNGNSEDSEPGFLDLRQLEEYSLAGMVGLLQQVRPNLSKGDAMWCLLMSDLHVGRASTIEIPVIPNPSSCGCGNVGNNAETVVSCNSAGVGPGFCRFHGGWGFGNEGNAEFPVNGFFSYDTEMTLQKDIECPKRFNLSPSMKSLLKRNVAAFAAGFRASTKQLHIQSQVCPSSLSSGDVPTTYSRSGEVQAEQYDGLQNSKSRDAINSLLGKFGDLNIDESSETVEENQKDEMIVALIHQTKDLEQQVKERKEWAHEKAMQAARKLSNDLTELKTLRMEREETQRLKKGKQALEDTTMKRLSEMENSLRKASGQVDRANAAVRRLETENAEIRAEMEASKLSASESVVTCLEMAKREKKCLKRLLAWEKQKVKLQEEIAQEKQKITDLKHQLVQIEQAQKEAEVKWRKEVKAKEAAFSLVEEERRRKEGVEASSKRKLETLRLKIEIDFQRHKDDIQRLEQELSRLKTTLPNSELPNNSCSEGMKSGSISEVEAIAKLLLDLNGMDGPSGKEVNSDRQCLKCANDEVSVVFLPCAHQVLCASCSDDHAKKGRATCPCCRSPIEQRIRVFGASS